MYWLVHASVGCIAICVSVLYVVAPLDSAFSVEFCGLDPQAPTAHGIVEALQQFPDSIMTISGVELCKLDQALPDELSSAPNREVLDYYMDLRRGGKSRRRCRLMLLGAGGAGKTSLAHWLAYGRQIQERPATTHGVDHSKFLKLTSLVLVGVVAIHGALPLLPFRDIQRNARGQGAN
jgi:hypothetical protein